MKTEIRAVLSIALVCGAGILTQAQTAPQAQAQTSEAVTSKLAGLPRDVACAPLSPTVRPAMPLKVTAGRETVKTLFGAGDAVVVSGGTAQGVRAGDEFFVRRVVADNFTEAPRGTKPPISVHTAGMLQIVEAEADVSIGVVTYGCDGVALGDYLERFQAPPLPPDLAGGAPDFGRPGRFILGDDRRQIGSTGEFMVLDRGSDHGIRAGQRLTIFRHTLPDGSGPVSTIGSATVYVVRPETSVVRIDKSVDAVYVGDLVAIHR
jgi:hypothetical protein